MQEPYLENGWDFLLLVGPLVALLLLGFFGLDEALSSSSRKRSKEPRSPAEERCSETPLPDPEGRPWRVCRCRPGH